MRMPPSAALEHAWLAGFEDLAAQVPLGKLPPVDSQYSQEHLPDSQGSAEADADADAPMDGAPDPVDVDASMREEPLPGSQLPGLPGSFPQSQPIQRRVDVLLAQSQQERGEDEDLVYSDDEETNGGDAVPGTRGTKRKALEFEGSLTPMEEEESEDPDAMLMSPRKPARTARRGGAGGQPPRKQVVQRGAKRATTTAGGTRRSERIGNGTPGKPKTL